MNIFKNAVALSLSLGQVNSDNPQEGLIHLLPLGEFTSPDGRPASNSKFTTWKTSLEKLEQIAEVWNTKGKDLVVDYEHQTQFSEVNGKPAPAAGWGFELFANEKGLFAKTKWTKKAKQFIADDEYRYISPVFTTDENGNIQDLISACLTNLPALPILETALKTDLNSLKNTGEQMSTEEKKQDLEKSKTEVEQQEAQKVNGALETKTQDKDAKTQELPEIIAAKAILQNEIDKLNLAKAELAVDTAISKQLLLPAQRSAAIDMAKLDLDKFNNYTATLKPLNVLGVQVETAKQQQETLKPTDLQLEVARLLGVSVDELLNRDNIKQGNK